jgi:predicted lysophospholipase L1 biosynthesis ABC-type transport system permease subunit
MRFSHDPNKDAEVVGIVSDARTHDVKEGPKPVTYLPIAQPLGLPVRIVLGSLAIRSIEAPGPLLDHVRRSARDTHPDLTVTAALTLRSRIESSLARERLLATLSRAFGLTAMFLVCLGLYGVMSRWAAQRTGEIGVRVALGSTMGAVRWLVLRQALALVSAGLLLGLPAALAAARVLEGMLFGVTPMDAQTIAVACLALLAAGALAAGLPAWRASRVDPMMALRHE